MDLPSNREGDTFNDTTSLLEAANFISKKVNVKAVILSVAVVWIFCVSIYLSTHTYEIWPASHLENSKIPLLDGKNQSCPRQPPPVDILELRQKVSKLLWENVDPMADYIMLVSAPRPHRPESDLLLPGYRQQSNIAYIMGEFYLEESAIVLKRCPDLCPHVFLPIRNQEFYGLPNFVALKKQFNAKFAFMDQLSTFLSKSLVHVGSPEDVFESVIKEYRPVLAQESVKCVLDPLIIELFNQARFIKTPSEIAAMRYAAQVGARAHQLISRDLEQLKSESMIELSLYMYSLQCGARLQAYNPVVAAGPHTTVLHFLTGETADRGLKPVLPGEFVLVDASASWQGYASDMTRTYAKDMTQEMRKMHNLVALALEKAKAKYVIGAAWNSVGEEAQRVLLKGLVECGILAGTFEQLTESGALQAFLPHAIGHPIGLEVHDTAPYSSYTDGQMNYNLTIGMVHAIEPGIYFIPHVIDGIRNDSSHHLHELIDWVVIEKFLHVGGIRLEDMVAIDYSGKAQVLNTIDW